ncbi:MAG: FAD-binding protein [Ignavibacteria bacterium]|nr:FAD-binding protein [Ignavibacteria bacterium]MBT8383190.1 FAD-binding protein [Ignavibacteria bacterium]MBT8392531.1 FAD-binding protein [Ignavibacteria bacterium]NNJ52472.1 FAD-binding protein [Ignavibacteriaceae bacterium]NNL21737.1 FAD-binding protein [Ignavibacteriaceae bacterium]
MKKQIELTIPPEKLFDKYFFKKITCRKLEINEEDISSIQIKRRSIDARKKPLYKFLVDVYIGEIPLQEKSKYVYNPVDGEKKAIVVGFGPAGMFASLRLIELGIKPIVIERGKDVRNRRRDLRELQQNHVVNPNSNYCFGEGGAGTYSDGKLYTRAAKRGNVKKVLQLFAQHGAENDILIDAHPHIGSNKLPKIVSSIRNTIIKCGGEVHYNSKVTDFVFEGEKLTGVVVNNDLEVSAQAIIVAVGHSARDIYYLLHKKEIELKSKPFAIGVRIEHPQALINEIQYKSKFKSENLPPAIYNLSCNVEERGIYSFCMCPGGLIVPTATSPGEIVINGMSLARRNSPFANSGLVVEVTEIDWRNLIDDQLFASIELQKKVEQRAFQLANNTQSAPAQRATDFIEGKFSQTLPKTSYIPGLTSVRLDRELPDFIVRRLKKALNEFNKKMKGYKTEEAVLVAAETRTSSPIRIPRDTETFMHIDQKGLFPCGEGAGYAGGIVSAAIDGENCADAVSRYLN